MATIRDVARLANVSPTTVSATLTGSAPVSEELKKRVWEAVEKANYRPDPFARNLRMGVSTTIGFVAPDIAAPWVSHLAKAVQRSVADRGYNMLLASNEDDPEREMADIALMISHRVAGLIIAPTSLGEGYAERFATAVSCPAVLVDRVVAPEKFDAVADDNDLGGTLVAEYLLRLGHKRAAMLVGRPGISASYERFDAVKAAYAKAGHPMDDRFVCHAVHTADIAYSEVQRLMSQPQRPTVIICISNPQVQGTMAGLKNMGLRVPDDVSVISFDGFNPTEGWDPSITCLVQDTATLSNIAVDRLLARMDDKDGLKSEVFRIRPRMRIGTSCAPPTA
ncbi:LacI family DNA-binding transcriptional regulator [uncultured Roseibium sp.]|uniref:LacI family DNA-binding transcriptional regulator n=1 Tax=uncultured Roseibium sp. TaxID=1936171 RepID=UPI00260C6302|nr:LacI family DNA-binding transcriptional regulator [uncultured Roseibium sp.]